MVTLDQSVYRPKLKTAPYDKSFSDKYNLHCFADSTYFPQEQIKKNYYIVGVVCSLSNSESIVFTLLNDHAYKSRCVCAQDLGSLFATIQFM